AGPAQSLPGPKCPSAAVHRSDLRLAVPAEARGGPGPRAMVDPRPLAVLERWRSEGMEAEADYAEGEAWPRAVRGIRWRPASGPSSAETGAKDADAARAAREFLAAEPDLLAARPEELAGPAILRGGDRFTAARFEQLHRTS